MDDTGILTRLSSSHTGDTRFVDFWRDPAGWLSLRDVTFPFCRPWICESCVRALGGAGPS
jgi:hypothetical protein